MAPEALRKQAETAFLKLQQCWQERAYEPMRALLMPDLFRNHSLEIAEMVRQHEINVIGDLRVDRIDLVNVRYAFQEEQREFTALITATACDYYIDDRTRQQIRGDTAPSQFQEFWTFQLHNKTWLVREIEQTRESDALKTENFFEQFTDTGLDQIYGDQSAKEGQAGPWLEQNVQTKETRIERMLNFLVQTDRIWDRQAMQETTRRVFLEMIAALESGNPAQVSADDFFPELAAHLKETMARDAAQGVTREYRNLCVRKVELILVRNFADNTRDEFVARVRAHAQKVLRRQGEASQGDQDVVPFEQYLTLGRLDNRWKLKEVLSAEAGQAAVKEENLDQDSSPDQVQWYYQHKRAV
jgi:predicted lipid-binding transport protein (Tim44 family)